MNGESSLDGRFYCIWFDQLIESGAGKKMVSLWCDMGNSVLVLWAGAETTVCCETDHAVCMVRIGPFCQGGLKANMC